MPSYKHLKITETSHISGLAPITSLNQTSFSFPTKYKVPCVILT